jgi:hypothetical protein
LPWPPSARPRALRLNVSDDRSITIIIRGEDGPFSHSLGYCLLKSNTIRDDQPDAVQCRFHRGSELLHHSDRLPKVPLIRRLETNRITLAWPETPSRRPYESRCVP